MEWGGPTELPLSCSKNPASRDGAQHRQGDSPSDAKARPQAAQGSAKAAAASTIPKGVEGRSPHEEGDLF